MMSDNNEDDCLVFDTCAVVRDRDMWDAVCDAAERGDANCMKVVDAVEDLHRRHKAEKVSCYDCWRYLPPDEQVGAAVVLFNSAGVEMAGTLFCRACASRYGTPADFFAVFGEADPATEVGHACSTAPK
jgi:hypothetical protein